MAEESIDTLLAPEKNELDAGIMGEDCVGSSDFRITGSSTDPLLTPENNEFDRGSMGKDFLEDPDFLTYISSPNHGRASIDSYHIGESSRRKSTGKSDSANSIPQVVPRYLRASIGSCHDFCKYGRKHAFDEKPWKPLSRRNAKPLPNEPNFVHIMVAGEPKKERTAVQKSSTDTYKLLPNAKPSPDNKSRPKKPDKSKQKSSTDTDNHLPDLKPSSDTKYYAPNPKTSKKKSSSDTNNHSPDLKPSPDTKVRLPKPTTGKQKSSTVSSNHLPDLKPSPKVRSPKLKTAKPKFSTDTNNHSPGLQLISPDHKVHSPKPKTYLDAKTHSPRKTALSGNNTHLRQYKPLSTKKPPSPDPPEIIKREVPLPSKTVEVPAKKGSSADSRTSRTENTINRHSKKVSSPPKLKTVKLKQLSAVLGKGDINRGVETGRKIAFRVSVKKTLTPSAATSSPKLFFSKTTSNKARKPGNLKFSPLKDRNRIRGTITNTSNNEKASEKTLHVIKLETEDTVVEYISADHAIPLLPSPSSPNSNSLSPAESSSLSSNNDNEDTKYSGSEADEFVSDNKKSAGIDEVQPVKENSNKTLRKSRVVGSEDKYRSPVKLKFRSGKVVDLNPDNTTPRRLKFRRARTLGVEDGKGDSSKRTFKKSGDDVDASGADHSSVKVVLKHQDVQGKKDAQGLFNNVIEETASKLVESRKSKVKALVGAFETVISLQES